jgi:excisionase family DNA binding protein
VRDRPSLVEPGDADTGASLAAGVLAAIDAPRPPRPGAGPYGRYVSVKEASALLGVHPQTVYAKLRSGNLRGSQDVPNGKWWILYGDLVAFTDPEAQPVGLRRRRSAHADAD